MRRLSSETFIRGRLVAIAPENSFPKLQTSSGGTVGLNEKIIIDFYNSSGLYGQWHSNCLWKSIAPIHQTREFSSPIRMSYGK